VLWGVSDVEPQVNDCSMQRGVGGVAASNAVSGGRCTLCLCLAACLVRASAHFLRFPSFYSNTLQIASPFPLGAKHKKRHKEEVSGLQRQWARRALSESMTVYRTSCCSSFPSNTFGKCNLVPKIDFFVDILWTHLLNISQIYSLSSNPRPQSPRICVSPSL
jgi:hypothetical protein